MDSGNVPDLGNAGRRRVLAVLCGTEIVGYGVLFYAVPGLAAGITADTGWSTGTITAAFSLALVVSAVVGIPVGRVLAGGVRAAAPRSPH